MSDVVGGVGIRSGTVAGEGDLFTVWRPSRFVVVKVAAGDLLEGFSRQIENVDVRAAAIEIAVDVFLELQSVDDPGAVGFFLFVFVAAIVFVLVLILIFVFIFRIFKLFRGRIAQDQR